MRHLRRLISWLAAGTLLLAAPPGHLHAETRPLDLERSTLTLFVFKSGLFSAFADNHTIRAPLAKGTISADPPLSVETTVRSADLRVLDPDLSASKRAEVQARMLGPEVLDTQKYSEISFASTHIEPSGQDRWRVAGQLTIHGQTKPVTFGAMREKDVYRGSFTIKQRDFGITPITVAGGTVKVKDELRIEFAIAATQ